MTHHVTRRFVPLFIGIRIILLLTVLLGIAYPLLITGIGQAIFPQQANGSLVQTSDGEVAGSSLIGQRFEAADGSPLPQYFQPRPSAAGDGYDPTASSGSNLGPENPDLMAQIMERKSQIARFNGVQESDVPVDAVTASGSGLDPHISAEYARIQVKRVAEERGLSPETVTVTIEKFTTGRDLGIFGESTVNIVELNLALDQLG